MKSSFYIMVIFLITTFSGCLPVTFPIIPSGRIADTGYSGQLEIYGTYNAFNLKMDSYYEGAYMETVNRLSYSAATCFTYAGTMEKKFEGRIGFMFNNNNSWSFTTSDGTNYNFILFNLAGKYAPLDPEGAFGFALEAGANCDLFMLNSGVSIYGGAAFNLTVFREKEMKLETVAAAYATSNLGKFSLFSMYGSSEDDFFGGAAFWFYGGLEFLITEQIGIKLGGGVYKFEHEKMSRDFTVGYYAVQARYTLQTSPFIGISVFFSPGKQPRGRDGWAVK